VSDRSDSSGGGIGVLGLLGVAFVVLKLTHVINWSWWYITMPFWGVLALLALIFIGYVFIAGAIDIVKSIRAQWRQRSTLR
jgi:hypothetical protein